MYQYVNAVRVTVNEDKSEAVFQFTQQPVADEEQDAVAVADLVMNGKIAVKMAEIINELMNVSPTSDFEN